MTRFRAAAAFRSGRGSELQGRHDAVSGRALLAAVVRHGRGSQHTRSLSLRSRWREAAVVRGGREIATTNTASPSASSSRVAVVVCGGRGSQRLAPYDRFSGSPVAAEDRNMGVSEAERANAIGGGCHPRRPRTATSVSLGIGMSGPSGGCRSRRPRGETSVMVRDTWRKVTVAAVVRGGRGSQRRHARL